MLLILVTGCAGQDRREPPDWSGLALPATPVTYPAELPPLGEMTVMDGVDGQRYGFWTADCWKALQAYEFTAEANTDAAKFNASALHNTEAAYAVLVSAGEMQQQLTEFYAELLKEERSGRFIDGLIYKILVSLGFMVVLL